MFRFEPPALWMAVGILAMGAIDPGRAVNADEPVKVFILAGQSNMEGKAQIPLLEYQLTQPETRPRFEHFVEGDDWRVREDVWIKFLDRHGNLTVGYGSPGRIGPELEFGYVMGDHFDEQVLVIKTAWGGKSLFQDFRPPSAGLPDPGIVDAQLENRQRNNPETTREDVEESFGFFYRSMIAEIEDTLNRLDELFPEYQGQGYEIGGFVWFQGWNDMINEDYTAAYTENMIHFIRDVRRDLEAPEMPFVIGQLGVGGVDGEPNAGRDRFKEAQAAAAELEEFQGNVSVVRTDQYWDTVAFAVFQKGWRENLEEWQRVGSDYPYHYLGSVRTYSDIGKGFAESLLELMGESP